MKVAWPHQERADAEFHQLVNQGAKRILTTSPTGGGKSYIMERIVAWSNSGVIYSNRKMLTDQLIAGLIEARMRFGVRAKDYEHLIDLDAPIQIASIQTEHSRVIKQERWQHFAAHVALVDEAHLQKGEMANGLLDLHKGDSSIIVGFTATPLGIGDLYDHLIVAGTKSELRKTGALLPCLMYAPDELDLSKIKKEKVGVDFSRNEIKAIWTQAIYGRVISHHKILNPDMRPALGMAPDVESAVWFASEYEKSGIPAAAVDGEEIWFRGERMKSTRENREMCNYALIAGQIKIIWNRFVYREAVNIPELYHLILACPIGSTISYDQVVGRVLRNHPSLDHVIIQDHGGNWYRHGSPNQDRDWEKYWKLDETIIAKERIEKFIDKVDEEPVRCGQCGMILVGGIACKNCGHVPQRSVRVVIQHDGTLKEKTGDVYQARRIDKTPDGLKKWIGKYHQHKKCGHTFAQAAGHFAYENYGKHPPKDAPMMPKDRIDYHRKIRDVPRNRLY